MPEAPKAKRLASIILMLRSSGTRTADDLAQALGVTVRTIYRDLEELSAAGVPIQGTPGPAGGYRLAEHYPVDPFVYVQADPPAGLIGANAKPGELGKALDTAVSLLADALPERLGESVRRARDRFLFDTSAWLWQDSKSDQFAEVKSAVLNDQTVELAYIHRDHAAIQSDIVDPYGLVWKQGNWYLVAFSHAPQKFVRHRVQRILGVRRTGRSFKRSADFSLNSTWLQLLDDFGRGTTLVRIRIDFPATKDFESFGWKPDQKITRYDDHWIVEMILDRDEWLIPLALTYGDKFQVLEPESLRTRIADALTAALNVYRPARKQEESDHD